MISRLISILIIGFWLLMTGLLMRAIWFPGDSRLDKISPGAVLRVIAARGEPSHLDIYENRRVVGKLNVSPMSPQLSGKKQKIRLHLDGTLDLRIQAQKLTVTGDVLFSHEGELAGIDLKLLLKSQKLELTIRQDGAGQEPTLRLTMLGMTLLDTSRNVREGEVLEANPSIALLLSFAGISPADLESARQKAEVEASATSLDARQGEFELSGRKHRGYVISVLRQNTPAFRMCVENTGQIMSIETPVSYRLITDDINERDAVPSGK